MVEEAKLASGSAWRRAGLSPGKKGTRGGGCGDDYKPVATPGRCHIGCISGRGFLNLEREIEEVTQLTQPILQVELVLQIGDARL